MKYRLLLISLALAGLSSAAISIDPSSWSQLVGGAALSGASSTGLVWGNNTNTGPNTGNADNSFLVATLDGNTSIAGNQTVSINVGETLVYTGTVNLSGVTTSTTGSLQFRFGLFNSATQTSTGFGWLGYFVGNGTSLTSGGLYGKNTGNNDGFIVESGATALSTFNGQAANLNDGPYTFSLSLQRTASSMIISTSFQQGGVSYASVESYVHTGGAAPIVSTFDRIGFLAGSGLDADQVTLSNLSLNIIPEPSSSALVLGAAGLLGFRRKR